MRAPEDIRYSVANRIETYATTNLSGLWSLVQRSPAAHSRVNRILIDRAILKIPTRPTPLSTKAGYTSWSSLTDRRWDTSRPPTGRLRADRPPSRWRPCSTGRAR